MLVMIDNLTKFVKLYAVQNASTTFFLKYFKSFVLDYGLIWVISDKGSCFTSKSFNEYCVSNGINHSLISVRHPQANGQVERTNVTLVPTIQASMHTDRTWDTELQRVESQLNNSVNKTIGDTHFHALFRCQFQ